MTRPEMMPQKMERGHQLERSEEPGRSTSWVAQDSGRSVSQNRRSQSHPRDEANSKKGLTKESASQSRKVQTGIDWANTGIQKPALRPNPQHPSFKPDPSGATDSSPPAQIKSSVTTKGSHHQESQLAGHRATAPASQESRTKTKTNSSVPAPVKFPGDPKKWEVKDKSYDWIARCMAWLDKMGFVEEIHSIRYFDWNSKTFAFEIISLADWGRRYVELGFCYPVPMFPSYFFSGISKSRQVARPSPLKLDSIKQLSSDVQARCMEAWTLMVSVLRF